MIIHNGKKYRLYMNGKEYVLPNNFGRFNTYIGGIGGVINTKQKLADLINDSNSNVNISNITNFQVLGDDIMFYIDVNYYIGRMFVVGSVNDWGYGRIVTYFIDVENKVYLDDNPSNQFITKGFRQQSNMTFFYGGIDSDTVTNSVFYSVKNDDYFFPNALELGNGCFFSADAENIYIPNCTTFESDSIFENTSNINIYYNKDLTSNLPSPLLVAQNTYGATLIPVLDQTPPSAITDLTVTDLGSNSYQFNFTTPASTNTIQNYRVFAFNGTILSRFKYYDTITASGDSLTLPSDTTKVWLQVADEYLNLSDNSNERSI